MRSLSLFNIGFRCENVFKVLNEYEDSGKLNKFIIEDSEKIITDCFKFQDSITTQFSSSNYEFTEYLPLVFEIFKGKTFKDMTTVLTDVKETIELLREERTEKIDVSSTKSFFQQLSELCINKNNIANQNQTCTLA